MICPTCTVTNNAQAKYCKSCGTSLSTPTLARGKVLNERYRLDKVLGQGGFGITYLADDQSLGRKVAIKELFPSSATRHGTTVRPPTVSQNPSFAELKDKFLDEARLLAQFKHDAIVRVLDLFEENGTAYIIMDYLEGESLQSRLQQEGSLAPQRVVKYAKDVLTGLSIIHSAGLLHRDLKPDNLIVTPNDQIVMIDFGSARNFDSGTMQHTRLVTPGYAPPEQYSTQAHFGPYTDLYALGATLYHALTGAPPPASTDRLMGTALRPLPKQIPAALSNTVAQALELRVKKRFQNTDAMLAALEPSSVSPKRPPSSTVTVPPTQPLPPPRPTQPTAAKRRKGSFLSAMLLGIALTFGVWQGWAQNVFGWRDTLASWVQVENPNPITLPSQSPPSNSVATPAAPTPSVIAKNPAQTTPPSPPQNSWQPSQEAQFIRDAEAGGTVRLAAGTFTLSETLTLTRDVAIIGAGRDRTIIQSRAGENAIEFIGTGSFSIRDLTVVHIGGSYSSVLGIGGGRAEIENIMVQGAKRDLDNNLYGEGIHFYNSARGTVRNSHVTRNEWSGIAIRGRAAPLLTNNEIWDNGRSGIAYGDEASGTAQDNISRDNARSGIYVGARATPLLESNILRNNGWSGSGWSGIDYRDQAGGNASRNVIERNSSHGILCRAQTNAVLENNILRDNGGYGLAKHTEATCRERGNRYTGNALGNTGQLTINENP